MIKELIRRYLVTTVPAPIAPCLDCDVPECHDYVHCPLRLMQIAAQQRDAETTLS